MFETFFYQPIFNLLVFIYNIVPFNDLGLAIIILTIVIKLALLPLSRKSLKSQKSLQDIQPKINELKEKYKNNKEEQGREMLKLYKENKVNPFSSCLPLLIQLPFLIAVFRVFRIGLNKESLHLVYPFITRPENINTMAFGFLDLSSPNVYLAVLAGGAQFFQTKMMMAKRPEVKSKGAQDEDVMAIMNKQMVFMMPILTIVIGITLPGGLTFYWFLTTLFTLVQQHFVFNEMKEKKDDVIEGEVVE